MIGIINYGVGNLKSVKNSLDHLNIKNKIINRPKDVAKCDRIILPGVGAFGAAMEKLNNSGFTEEIKKFAKKDKPILGICLGMQLLFDESEEYGNHKGLGLIKGKVLPFDKKVKKLPVPLIGWSETKNKGKSVILNEIDNASFYSVHSFYCQPADKKIIISTSKYDIEFPAIICQKKIFGAQFHPEKSQKDGLQLLKNFSLI